MCKLRSACLSVFVLGCCLEINTTNWLSSHLCAMTSLQNGQNLVKHVRFISNQSGIAIEILFYDFEIALTRVQILSILGNYKRVIECQFV